MEILEKQYLSVESLLSFKTRTTYRKLYSLMAHLDDSLSLLGLKKTGSTIFTLTENQTVSDEPILDVEIMIPVNEQFKSNEYYVYKPKIRLTNALRGRCSYDYNDLNEARKEMQHYINRNSHIPLTPYFYKLTKNNGIDEVDIYVSVNENIV